MTQAASQPRDLEAMASVADLDEALSRPTPYVIEALDKCEGDIIILGAGGKMGPTLARMARRALDELGRRDQVIAVSRYSDPKAMSALNEWSIKTIPADLLDETAVANLPDAANVVFMAGMKFGSTGDESRTWAMNTYLPAIVAKRYSNSRTVVFSTGNVYGLCPIHRGGSVETDTLNPVGEYAISCVGRERIFEFFSRNHGTPVSIIRLNYAVEMRYGVLVDLAEKIKAGTTIDLAMGTFNAIWQGDANAMSLAGLAVADSPPCVLNVAGPELLSVRRVCERMAGVMGKTVTFTGSESPDALLNNGQKVHAMFGYPHVPIEAIIDRTARWVAAGGASLNKATHFENREGKF